jgi:xanthine dehydrogenase YagR molybdenum-binding subunit
VPRTVTFVAGIEGAEREVTVEIRDDDVAPWGLDANLRVVGREFPREDGPVKTTGRAVYTQDVRRPRMAYSGFVGSPHAHAKVASVDASRARAMKGVLDVETFEGRRLTYAGQPVAAVCAESEAVLDDALRAIVVRYEVLPHAVTVEAAMADDAPRVDPQRANAGPADERASREAERADRAVADAEVSVEGEFRTQVQTHTALEPHGVVVEPGDDGATVWASTQSTFSIAPAIAEALGVHPSRIRTITEHMGGGFGAKFGCQAWDLIAARFAKKLGRPVHQLLPRRLEHLVGGNRPDSVQRLALAGKRDGTLVALVGTTVGTSGNGMHGAGCAVPAVYRIPHVRMAQRTVSTFTERGAAFRAPGHPQGLFGMEGAIELFARKAGLDPLDVRLRNDPHPVRQMQWRLGSERIGWKERRRTKPGSDAGPRKRGLGCAAAVWYQKGSIGWNVDVTVHADGAVTVANGAQDIGTGTRTVLQIMVAEELGLEPGVVRVRLGDTDLPRGPGSGGSQTAPALGPVARQAAVQAREKLAALVALEWDVEPDAVRWEEGSFRSAKETPGAPRRLSFRDACALIGNEGLSARATRHANYAGYEDQTAGCQFAEVEVDVETGVVRVERVVAVHDAGRIVNALTARSQVNGGVIQGVSYALFEERRLDANVGDMVNPTMDTYRIAGMRDCPQIDVVLTSVASGFNNAGMMGLGEPATVPTAAAVAGAVLNATGVPMTTLPMTPARVLAALNGRGS